MSVSHQGVLEERRDSFWRRHKDFVRPLGLLAFLWLIFAALIPQFLSVASLLNILRNASICGLVGIGLCTVVISGEMDLSVGAVMSFGAIVAALGMTGWGLPAVPAVLLALAGGALMGLANGVLVTYFKVNSLIVTFVTMNIFQGITYKLSRGQTITGLPYRFSQMSRISVLGIPLIFWILVVAAVALQFFLSRTYWGKYIYAVGDNLESARFSGVNVVATKMTAFAICGVLSALAGVLVSSRLNNGLSLAGSSYEFKALVVVALSGIRLTGGTGSAWTVILGALAYIVIDNGLIMLKASAYDQLIVQGVIVLAAIIADIYLPSIRKKGRREVGE